MPVEHTATDRGRLVRSPGRAGPRSVSVYEAHYGFTEKPFNLTPDPKYLYSSQRHTDAFAHLEFGRRERGGFIVITGEVGTGKTTLARYFLSRLDARTATAFVLYPALTGGELLRSILQDLHVPVAGTSLKDHVDALHRFLLQARAQGRDVVLLIDEAQDLSPEVLEQVRLISNLETDTEKLIQIVLMGQSELHEMLGRRDLRQLAQRVTARYHLTPLDRSETEDVRPPSPRRGRRRRQGHLHAPPRSRPCTRLSGGVPRLVNLVCDRALLAGYVQGTREIDAGDGEAGRARGLWVARPGGRAGGSCRSRPPRPGCAGRAGRRRRRAAVRGHGAAGGPRPLRVRRSRPPTPAPTPAPGRRRSSRSCSPPIAMLRGGARGATCSPSGAAGPPSSARRCARIWIRCARSTCPPSWRCSIPSRRDTCFVACCGSQDGQAMVAVGEGAPCRVRCAELDRLWTRQAVFLWRDFDALGAGADAVRAAAWTAETLGRLGYVGPDLDLASAIARFQRDTNLTADGLIGARTLMTLYSRGSYPQPRLRGGAS